MDRFFLGSNASMISMPSMWNSASTVSSSPTLAANVIRSPASSPLGSRAPAALQVHEPSGRWLVNSISILRDTGGHATASALACRTAVDDRGGTSAWSQHGGRGDVEAPKVKDDHAGGWSETSEHPRIPGDASSHLKNGLSSGLADATGEDGAVKASGVDIAGIAPQRATAFDERGCGPLGPGRSQISASDQVGMVGQRSGGHRHSQTQRQQHDRGVHRSTAPIPRWRPEPGWW